MLNDKCKATVGYERLRSFFDFLQVDLNKRGPHDVENIEFAKQRLSARSRKRAITGPSDALDDITLSKFLSNNESLSNVDVHIDPDILSNARYFISHHLMLYTLAFDDEPQCELSIDHLYDLWRYGPGASYETQGTHFCQKVVQQMTCTASCVPFIKKLRSHNFTFSAFDSTNNVDGYSVVKGSQLFLVPKNEETHRTIAIEPSGNMCLQLAAGVYLQGVLKTIGLDITTQSEINKDLARAGSIDGITATMDLSMASDRITPRLVSLLFPPEWTILLDCIRSREIYVPSQDEWVKLNMISTMGNGFTFPMMTLIISALIYGMRASRNEGRNLRIDWTNTAVFGDDIILPVDEYHRFSDVLVKAGFLINYEKSYAYGSFRESCGGDFYGGYNVTPFYVESLTCDTEVYVAVNKVLDWCCRHKVYLASSLTFLFTLIPRPFIVPEYFDPSQGVRCAQVTRKFHYLKRYAVPDEFIPEFTPFRSISLIEQYARTRFYYKKPKFDKDLGDSYKEWKIVSIDTVELELDDAISDVGDTAFFLPRGAKLRFKAKKARLPKGLLNGSYRKWYSKTESDLRVFYLEFLEVL